MELRAADLLVFAAAGSLLPFLAVLIERARENPSARHATGFLIGVLCFLALPTAVRMGGHPGIILGLVIGQVAASFFFWLFCLTVARDDFRPTWHWFVLVAKVGFSLLSIRPDRSFLIGDLTAGDRWVLSWLPPALFSAVLIGLALVALSRGLSDDLVEERKRLRITLLIAVSAGALIMIPIKLGLSGQRLQVLSELSGALMVLGVVLFFSTRYVRLDAALLGEPTPDARSDMAAVDIELQQALDDLFEEERFYRTEGLTIRLLAERLSVPEYRLRRLINRGLGFRNFNDFLNRRRIEEAQTILADPAKSELPIVRLALDLGYRSLAGFNDSFKKIVGSTPTAFRRAALASRNPQ